ncbi:MAG: aconitate hydratase AcnA [Fimbriimonadaceae bacterium]|nr:aconitate hydratase AcnA [Fimbriimonadaceae bacterium]
MANSFNSLDTLQVGDRSYRYWRLDRLAAAGYAIERLPFALRILLENLLRREDGVTVTAADIRSLASWDPAAEPANEIAFMPARVLMQDFTGVPAVVDLAAMRDAMAKMGGQPTRINPLQPVELVIDHSVQVDAFGSPTAMAANIALEYERNGERYKFLRWGQQAFSNFRVVPPATGIVHQVNIEHLARVVMALPDAAGLLAAYPDTLVGTDSHTTMVNGLGVLGWGVGGIEAEAAMLGQPVSMLVPQVVGFELTGKLREGVTATDLVLTVTQVLRQLGVVGKFVEFCGPGLADLPLADRATIANMCPEFGATCAIFPVDAETLRYLEFTGRQPEEVALVEAYCRAQGLFTTADTPTAAYTQVVKLDLSTVEFSLAGPKRPQDRVVLSDAPASFAKALETAGKTPIRPTAVPGTDYTIDHGAVVIAAITSCTNTSNPAVLIRAGLLAKAAVERGLTRQPWVKTSLAPGSKVVTEYLTKAGLLPYLEQLGFHVVGYGCTTCIGNSGPLPTAVAEAIEQGDLVVASVLSGNRNFEGRVHAAVRANYLASPPLVVAYALAGRMDLDLRREPLGVGSDGQPVYLHELWPTNATVAAVLGQALQAGMFSASYADAFAGDERWQAIAAPAGDTYAWDAASTYVQHPPYFVDLPAEPTAVTDLTGARVLAVLGDSVTTDHISPAGNIKADSPAGRYLRELGVAPADFNSYGSRRGNHEIMMRGTFANVRLRNQMVPGVEGGFTAHQPSGRQLSIYDAAMRYRDEHVPSVILAGQEYGSGSSRDWAAKGPALLGVRAVIAESFERIHRSNLIGMGLVPLQFAAGQNAASLGLTGQEVISLAGVADYVEGSGDRTATVTAVRPDGLTLTFPALIRIDTPQEKQYLRHGGILPYVLRQLLAE